MDDPMTKQDPVDVFEGLPIGEDTFYIEELTDKGTQITLRTPDFYACLNKAKLLKVGTKIYRESDSKLVAYKVRVPKHQIDL